MSLINSAIKTVAKPYTSKGYRLLSKSLNIPTSNNGTMDIVEIASEFGNGHTTITSFKDEKGKLVQRIIDKNGSKGHIYTSSEYEGNVTTQRRKVSTTSVNGKLTQKTVTRNVYSPDKGGKLDREHLTINYSPNKTTNEVQYIESRAPHGVHSYVKTTASRNSVGEYTHTAIESNTLPQAELDKYAQTPYVFSKNYSKEDFLKAVAPYAKEKQNVSELGIKIKNKKLKGNTLGLSYNRRYKIGVDVEKHTDKAELIDTINHELRHKYQDKLISKYEPGFFKEFDGILRTVLESLGIVKPKPASKVVSTLSDENMKLAKIFKDNKQKYIKPSSKNYNDYYNQPVEVDARNAGAKAKDEYKNILDVLADRLGVSNKLNWNQEQIAMYEFITNAEKEGNVVKIDGLLPSELPIIQDSFSISNKTY